MDPAKEVFDVVRAGDIVRLKALLASQPGLANARNERGHSPVLIAQYHHKAEAVAVLLAAGPDLDLFDAASVGDSARVRELLERDPALVNAYSSDGFYPLGLAAFFGHPETVRVLLSHGADVAHDARNPMRVQALHAGAASKSVEVVQLLVDAGAPVNAQQDKGWTPLHEAVRQGNEAMVRLLLAHGADPKLQNDDGKSAIGLAADETKPAILKLLKGQG
jgi:ankyrin repeat protein